MTLGKPSTRGGHQADREFDDLVWEVSAKIEAGESIDLAALREAWPEHFERLQGVLPALQAMAELGHSPADPTLAAPTEERQTGEPLRELGDFRIVREIGRGGMGVVYEAEQISLKRRVALKVLPFAAVLDQRQLQRFTREAEAAGSLHHHNIVPVYSVGCERGVHYYAMQFVDGQTLAGLIGQLRQASGLGRDGQAATTKTARKAAPPTPRPDATTLTLPEMATTAATTQPAFFRSVAQLGIQVAEALDHAHQQGVVHRDIKPSNLMVDAQGKPWITDFGLAHVEAGPSLTVSGDLLGTLRYMSPEQALAKRVVIDHRSDIYSLGVTLYELLTLRPVFSGMDRRELLRQIAFDEPRPPRKLNKAIPADLETILVKAMAKEPAERYATAQEFADDLRRFLDVKPIRARRPTVLQRAAKWARRHTPLVWSAAALLVMATVGSLIAATLIWNKQKELEKSNQALREERGKLKTALDNAEKQRKYAVEVAMDGLKAFEDIFARQTGKQILRPKENGHPEEPQLEEKAKPTGEPAGAGKDDQALLRRVLEYYESFAGANTEIPELRGTVEKTYRTIVTAREEIAGDSPHVVGNRRALAVASSGLGTLLGGAGRSKEAEDAYRRAITTQQELVNAFPSIREYRTELAMSHRGLAAVLKGTGRRQAAEQLLEAAGELERGQESVSESAAEWQIRFPEFSDATSLTVVGDAAVREARLLLTPAENDKVGGVWLADKQCVALGFETTFQFRMSGGADGLAFAIQNHSPSALGPPGSGLGYGATKPSRGGIPNSLAVEFDTHSAGDAPERVDEQHISIQTNGTAPNSAYSAFSYGLVTPSSKLDDDKVHTARIRYVPGTLTVILDDLSPPALTVSLELAATLDLDAGRAWVGFTAATGNECQAHEILSWQYAPLVEPGTAVPPGWVAGVAGHEGGRTGEDRKPQTGGPSAAERAPHTESAPQAHSVDLRFLRKALGLYKALAAQEVTDPAVRLEIGKAYWRAGEIQEQLDAKDDAMASYLAAIELWRGLVAEHPGVPAYERPLTRGREWLEKARPKDADWYHDRGHRYWRNKEFAEAAADFSSAIEVKPDDAHILGHRGDMYVKLGQYDKALVDLSEAIKLDPQYAGSWNSRGGAIARLGRWDEAVVDYSKAIELAPRKALYWGNRGYSYMELSEFSKAVADYSKAIELDPRNAVYWSNRGYSYMELSEFSKAVADYSKAIELDPSIAYRWAMRGVAHSRLGRWAEAERDYTEALRLGSEDDGLWKERAGAYLKLGRWGEAAADLSKAIELEPEEGWHWSRRGYTHAQSGRWDEAAADTRKATELSPDSGRFASRHAMVPLGAGNVDRYRERCERLVTRFAEAEGEAAWPAWACMLVPDAVAEPARLVRLAEAGLGADPKGHSNLITLGAALYRAGRFDDATLRLKEVHAEWDQAEVTPTACCCPAHAWLFLAMAHQRRGNAEEARRWLDKAIQWTAEVLQEGTLPNGLPLSWSRRLALELLRREAEATVVARRDVEPTQHVRDAAEAMRAAVRKATELREQRERAAREERERVVREAWSQIAALAEGEIDQPRADQLLRRIDDFGARVPVDDIPADVKEQVEALRSRAKQAAGWQRLFDGKTLNGWRVVKAGGFTGHAQVEAKKGEIVLERGDPGAAVVYTGPLPTQNYEVSVDVMRLSGPDREFSNITFPVGRSRCMLFVGGPGATFGVGLDMVNGLRENKTARHVAFENGRWYTVRLRVTQARIEAWVDGKQVIDFATAGHVLTLHPGQLAVKPFGFNTWHGTRAVLRNIRLRRLERNGGEDDNK